MKKMKLVTAIAIVGILTAAQAFAAKAFIPGVYQIDSVHSKLGFEVPHLVISTVEGRFNTYQGKVSMGKNLGDLKADIEVEVKSVDTGIEKRDNHLRSGDFFDAEKFPKMTFMSKRVSGTPENFKM